MFIEITFCRNVTYVLFGQILFITEIVHNEAMAYAQRL